MLVYCPFFYRGNAEEEPPPIFVLIFFFFFLFSVFFFIFSFAFVVWIIGLLFGLFMTISFVPLLSNKDNGYVLSASRS